MKARDVLAIDFFLLLPACVLIVFGVLFIYSSGVTSQGVSMSNEFVKQIIWGGSGLLLAILLSLIDYKIFYQRSVYLYFVLLGLLIFTLFRGRIVNGARAWLGFGGFGIQPSEFAKITTILFLAWYLDFTRKDRGNPFLRFAVSCAIVLVPMLVILLQPDFGTSLVFIPILLVMTYTAGAPLRYVAFLTLTIAFTSVFMVLPLWQTHILGRTLPLLGLISNAKFIVVTSLSVAMAAVLSAAAYRRFEKKYFYWISWTSLVFFLSLTLSFASRKVLKEYQIMRLIVFLDPQVDPRGSGWNILQSITAIGSGGIWGKGFLAGTQSHYRFLPQQSTDFIFSIFSEEWGLAGGLLVFTLFFVIIMRFIRIVRASHDGFGAYMVSGFAAMFIFHFLINVGMTMGIMPITGIPLLFMSYGGSSLISAMSALGLALSVNVHRFHSEL